MKKLYNCIDVCASVVSKHCVVGSLGVKTSLIFFQDIGVLTSIESAIKVSYINRAEKMLLVTEIFFF